MAVMSHWMATTRGHRGPASARTAAVVVTHDGVATVVARVYRTGTDRMRPKNVEGIRQCRREATTCAVAPPSERVTARSMTVLPEPTMTTELGNAGGGVASRRAAIGGAADRVGHRRRLDKVQGAHHAHRRQQLVRPHRKRVPVGDDAPPKAVKSLDGWHWRRWAALAARRDDHPVGLQLLFAAVATANRYQCGVPAPAFLWGHAAQRAQVRRQPKVGLC